MRRPDYSYRRLVIGGISILIVIIYAIRLFSLQIMSEDYRRTADSNAFLKRVQYPSRGLIYDRNGKLVVYNEVSYDVMIVTNEAKNHLDTLAFCETLGITKDQFLERLAEIKDSKKNPGYSRFSQQLFMGQLDKELFLAFREKLFRFPGIYVRKRTIRQYVYPNGAHVLGDVGEVSQNDIDEAEDRYYGRGDYIGKLGVERSYEKYLRGVKGIQIMVRDARGRVQGHYRNGQMDRRAVPGKNITLSIDIELQALAERLMKGKIGSIVAIEPSTGEVLCMVSAPSYDPRGMIGKQRSKTHQELGENPFKPLLNRAIMGQYPPGSTFKPSQALTFLSEGILTPYTPLPCNGGFNYKRLRVGCHPHPSPISLSEALSTSCNGYFCWGLYYMMGKHKYGSLVNAMNKWRDYMVSMGFGYKLGIDLPGEKRGMIPNGAYYNEVYRHSWGALSVISISIGQGEVNLTPLQIANLGATIANRGYYYIPHVVRQIEGASIDSIYTERHRTKAATWAYQWVVRGMRQSAISGTCKALSRLPFSACGKTGTAQNKGHDHSVFMGFAPMDKPRIAVAVYVENGGFGADFGVPIGALVMEKYINGKLSPDNEVRARDFENRSIYYSSESR